MLQRLRNYLLLAIIVGIFYFLLSHHVLFSSPTSFNILTKSELTLKNTFVSLRTTPPETLLRNDALRASGVDELLVDLGLASQKEINRLLRKIDRE